MIFRKGWIFLLALMFGLCVPLFAQEGTDVDEDDGRGRFPIWRCTVLPAGVEFSVRLGSVTFVSTQEYIVDGLALVTELNIVTDGPMLVRYYSVEGLEDVPGSATARIVLNSAKAKLEALQRRADPTGVSLKVVKTYPATTHAGTVEYRLRDRGQVMKLYKSVERAWRKQRNTKIKVNLEK